MNRRQMMMFSGAAAAAAGAQGLGQAQLSPGSTLSHATQRASYKTLIKLDDKKSSYKIPKTDSKKTKYLQSLTTALTLTPAQQQQTETIFTDAVAARATLRTNLKTARQNLMGAVKDNNTAAIDQISAMVGSLKARLISTGAYANAAFHRILAPEQQAKLTQFQS